MARLFPWDLVTGTQGSKSEATHYSTMWNEDWVLLVRDGVTYYWNGYWKKTTIFDGICLTPIGEEEPNYKVSVPCPLPEKKEVVKPLPKTTEPEYYRSNRGHYVGD